LRSQGGELEVKAPGRFLKGLVDWCDGDRSLSEVEALAQRKWGASSFAGFLRAMLSSGVLVDASTVALRALASSSAAAVQTSAGENELDWQAVSEPARWPKSRVAGLEEALELVAHALAPYIAEGSAAMRVAAVRSFIFAPEGSRGESLTGADLARIAGREVEVHARSSSLMWRDIYRAIANPESLQHAHALVVVAAIRSEEHDEDSRSRTRRQLLTTGAALQRAEDALRQVPFELSQDLEFESSRLSLLCGVEAHEIIGCATIRSRVPQRSAPEPSLKLRWMPAAPVHGSEQVTHVVRAELLGANTAGIVGWGRSPDAKTACDIAVSEIVERYSYRRVSLPLTRATGMAMRLTVDPRRWGCFASEQYANAVLGVAAYDPNEERHWVKGRSLEKAGDVWLPAECVFSIGSLPAKARISPLMKVTSSGCASDVDVAVARERAAYEIIERDAFLRHWLAQRPCSEVSPTSLSVDLAARVSSLSKLGLRVVLGAVQGDLGPVAIAGVISPKQGFFVLGSACAGSAEESLGRALTEASVAANARLLGTPRRPISPSAIHSPSDHGDLYAQRRYFEKALALFADASSETMEALEARWPRSVKQRLRSAGKPACWVDLSASEAPASLDGRRIHTVRVLIADTIPIAFGRDAVPRGMAHFVKRGLFPHPLA